MINARNLSRFRTAGLIGVAGFMISLGCSDKKGTDITPADLIGTWKHQEYYGILSFNEDGAFEEEFEVLAKPELGKILVKGTWSLDGLNLKYVITYSSNKDVLPEGIAFVDQVVSITDSEFTYLAAPNKKRVTLLRKSSG